MIKEVLDEIVPKKEEKKRLEEISSFVCSLVDEKAKELGFEAKASLVGSSARETWISGDRDIDVFILFPKEYSRSELEKKGLKLAREVAEESDSFVEDYAEHPYLRAIFDGFDVDLVPAYNIDDAREVSSAVDRTPLHDRYVSGHLNDVLRKNIRLLKKFMKEIGVYGAELRTKGFSGYLTELLVINYSKNDSEDLEPFENVLRSAANWEIGEVIDLEGYGTGERFDSPLVVVDPVDEKRNVAAALEKEQWARFIAASQFFLEKGIENFFKEKNNGFEELNNVKNRFSDRGTELIGIEFDSLDLVDDTLFPQLYKTEKWIKNVLEEKGFNVIRSDVYKGEEKNLVLLELLHELPPIEKHFGPPIFSKKHSNNFLKKYMNKELFSGPYIEGDRWVVERKREQGSPTELLRQKIMEKEQSGLGKDLEKTNKSILRNDELFKKRYIDFLSNYLNKKEKWL